ncbi:Transcriptional regulatory protein tctD [Polaromonas vacuolata]|uniref:Transcriptional regulatory protein tctD n=1 Tax=Polaromonas vacuolata TaxID=37448 RepID=A0A6H2HBB3_9BURK|nr:response regulator transcription factor [Polaromonas vacuolata]QJC57168.1 Transcriptional regulatory protein tctD [Polaromonas vacuolata]
MKLLLIEDDASMQTALKRALSRREIDVTLCSDGLLALEQWLNSQADVVVLDLSLPGQDGLQLLSQARGRGLTTPVLILTARGTVGDRVMGLNLGADDYLAKPFDLDELEARLRALHRRRTKNEVSAVNLDTNPEQYSVGELRYDQASGAIYHLGLALELTPRELTLLQTLMLRPGHAVAKEKLFELVFPGAIDVQYEAVEVVVYRLRKKLIGKKVNLMTLRGLGYLLKAES